MPASVALGAAQVVIVPSFSQRVPVHVSAPPNSTPVAPASLVTPIDGKVLLPWISNIAVNTVPNLSPGFVTQSGDGPLVFTGPGYVNFYLVAPATAGGDFNALRIVGIVYKNSANETGTATNQADNNAPVSGISLIPFSDPVLAGLNAAVSTYNSGSATGVLSSINPTLPTPFATSTGIQVYNAYTNPSNLSPWQPEWRFYIIFQWGDGMLSMIDPDEEDIPPTGGGE